MSTSAGKKLKLTLNYQGISLEQCRQQGRHFNRAFQYLIKPSWQLAISQIFLSAIPLTTFLFSARLSHTSLIAVGFGTSISNMLGMSVCYALALACEELAVTKKEFSDATTVIQRGLFYSLTVVCFPMWALWINAGAILKVLGQDPVQSKLAEEYCFALLPALPIFILVIFLQKYMYLVNQTSILPMLLCNFLGAILNVGLNAVFVIVLKLDVRGSALATVLTYVCLALFSFLCIMWRRQYRAAWPGWRWDLLLDWGSFCLQSLPYILWIFAEWWTLDAGIYIVGTLNAFDRQITSQILLCFIIHFLSMITHQFTSEAADQIKDAISGRYKLRAVFILKCTVLVTWICSFICGSLLVGLKYVIPESFLNNRPFPLSTAEMIVLVAPIPFLKGTQAIGFNVMRKMGSRYSHIVAVVVGYWIVSLPICFCLVYLRAWSVRGIWTGYIIGLLFQAIFFLIRLKSYMREWMSNEGSPSDTPLTPSGTLKYRRPEFDDTDGGQGLRSLLLKEPRILMRFNSVEISNGEETERPRRPSARVLAMRSLLFCLSSSTIIAALVVRYTLSGSTATVSSSN